MNVLYLLITLCLLTLLPTGYGFAADKFLTIGTGGVTGVYYPTGSAISKLMNQKRSIYGFKVTAEATGGSVFNINAMGVGNPGSGMRQNAQDALSTCGLKFNDLASLTQ